MSLKSSRYVDVTPAPCVLLTAPSQRFHNEVHVWALLHQQDINVVPLVGVYSTDDHPFGLVYEYMDGLDLKQHLRNEPNMGRRLKLVPVPTSARLLLPIEQLPSLLYRQLKGIAQGLKHIHDLGIVHGSLDSVRPPTPHTRVTGCTFTSCFRQTSWLIKTALRGLPASAAQPFPLARQLGRWRTEPVPIDFLVAARRNWPGRGRRRT